MRLYALCVEIVAKVLIRPFAPGVLLAATP
jgi:hypothetical protein